MADLPAFLRGPVPVVAPVRVVLVPPGSEPLALYGVVWARTDPASFDVELAHDYPGLVVETGWAVKGRGFAGAVSKVEGRVLTCEVTP